MLQTFRKHSGGIFAKVLFGLLVASFAFFGIEDIFSSYTSMQPIAKVGEISISQEEFMRSYQKIVTRMQTMAKGKLKPDDIRRMGIDKRVLDDLVNSAVLDNEIKYLGLRVSNAALEGFIKSVPAFQNKAGQFDRNQFRYLLYSNEMSESGFINESREGLLKQQLIGTLSASVRLPEKYKEIIFLSQEQQKVFDAIYLPLAKGKVDAEATDQELEQLYQLQQDTFAQPELRTISVLIVDPVKVQAGIKIPAERLQQEYEARRDSFKTPELRDVMQLTFTSKSDAEKAQSELAAGQTPAVVLKAHKGDAKTYAKAGEDKFSADHAKAIFATAKGGVTDVLSSAFGWAVFKITDVEASHVLSFDKVKDQIESSLKNDIYAAQMTELQNKIEDGLAGGTPAEELAKEYHLEAMTFKEIDNAGFDVSEKSVVPEKLKEVVLENAFSQDEGVASSLINTTDGRSVAVVVNKITHKMTPAFNDIKPKVKKVWFEQRQREAVAKLAQDIVAKTKSKADFAAQAKSHGLSVRTLAPVSRVSLEEGKYVDDKVTPQALRVGFALAPTQAGFAPVKDGYVVLMPVKTLPFDLVKNKEKHDNFDKALKLMVQRDFQESYIEALKKKIKLDIRQDVLQRLLDR
ncbi:MAG: SurA N-terminal domain-containing protein [Candidatus Paracaedibacteraceae bacterium]|nr:SurA N-terminal domain-containing protein [Candidatus Paracaedibacteraceae bacterium]